MVKSDIQNNIGNTQENRSCYCGNFMLCIPILMGNPWVIPLTISAQLSTPQIFKET